MNCGYILFKIEKLRSWNLGIIRKIDSLSLIVVLMFNSHNLEHFFSDDFQKLQRRVRTVVYTVEKKYKWGSRGCRRSKYYPEGI